MHQRVQIDKQDIGMVVGIADDDGVKIISCGNLNAGSDEEVNGDTVFALHSMTSHFTGMLLQDMIERGEMKLDDPVSSYLPKSVKMPTYNGREITLRHLVTETSGLPEGADNLNPQRAERRYAEYTVEKMYGFLSGYKLTIEPGASYSHGGVSLGLLGHVIALKAGTNFETLLVDRICQPLKMEATRLTLSPEMRSRLLTEHLPSGMPTLGSEMEWGSHAPLAGLHSTVNDMLRFLSAFRTPSSMTPLMEKNLVHFPWASLDGDIVQLGGGAGIQISATDNFDTVVIGNANHHSDILFINLNALMHKCLNGIGKILSRDMECKCRY